MKGEEQMILNPEITSFSLKNRKAPGNVVMIVSGPTLPVQQKLALEVGLIYLKVNTVYYAVLTVECDGKTIIKDDDLAFPIQELTPNNKIVDDMVGATFNMNTPIVNLTEGAYKVTLKLLSKDKKQLSQRSLYFFAKED